MSPHSPRYSKGAQFGIILGAILVFIGLARLFERFFGSTWWGAFQSTLNTFFSYAWPIALICVGVCLVWASQTGRLKNISFDASRPLRRNSADKRISGVCGGIARYFNVDSTIVRVIATILLLVTPGAMLLIYIVCTILMPKD